jgi:hypothetical protein
MGVGWWLTVIPILLVVEMGEEVLVMRGRRDIWKEGMWG